MYYFEFMKKIKLICIMMCLHMVGHAQFTKQISNQFFDFMLAYPDNFSSLAIGPYDSLFENYAMKGNMPNVTLDLKRKNNIAGKYIIGIIKLPEIYSFEQFRQKFDEWSKNFSMLNFNGAKLVEEKDDRYEKDYNSMYVKGKKWKIDNSLGNIAAAYKTFSIRLEFLDLMEGGLMLEFIIGNENLKN